MKKLVIKLLTGNFGRIKSALTALVVGGVSWLVGRLGLELGSETMQQVTFVSILAAGWLLEGIAAKIGVDGVKRVQEALKTANGSVRTDGDAGRITLATLEQILVEAGYNPGILSKSSRAGGGQ